MPTGEAGYPILWQNGVTTRLPIPAGTVWAVPEDINVFGDIAGIAALPDEFFSPRAMVWRRGQPIVLEMFPGGFISQALAINDWGLVAGIADDGVRTEATVWLNGTPRFLGALPSATGFPYSEASDLGTLPGDTHSWAYAINDRGQIVGVSANVPASTERAFVWEDGVMRELGIPPGALYSAAADINVFGVAAGVVGTPRPHAALFARGQVARLPTPPDEEISNATDVNNLGDAVGGIATATRFTGVVWLRRP